MNTTLNAALVKALGELSNISKDKINPHFKNKYAGLDSILDAVRPVFSKHGLAITQLPQFQDGLAGVVTRIIHTSGESTESTLLLPLRDQSAQSVGSALSYARRYSIISVCGICGDDSEDDGQVASTPSKAITKPVIAKPVIPAKATMKQVNSAFPAESVEVTYGDISEGTRMPQNALDMLFSMMTTNKLEKDDILAFCASKGMKAPEYVSDLPDAAVNRLVAIFDEVVEFAVSR
jgi:hypothetical protein